MPLTLTKFSFIKKPTNFSFNTKQENEKVVLVLKQHWFVWVKWLLPIVFLSLLPILIIWGNTVYDFGINIDGNLLLATLLFWQTIIVFYVFERFLLWYFSVDIVTNERIIDTKFIFPFYKKVSQLHIRRIQDMSDVTNGFFPSLFNYGDLRIETAGETSGLQVIYAPEASKKTAHAETAAAVPNFVFKSVPKLETVQKIIDDLANNLKDKRNENPTSNDISNNGKS